MQSVHDFATTLARFVTALEERDVHIFMQGDYAAGAASVNRPLRPTTLVVFGNPAARTALMQAKQTAGIDLPLKAVVWQDADETVKLSYNDPAWIATRHGLAHDTDLTVVGLTAMPSALARHATSGRDAACLDGKIAANYRSTINLCCRWISRTHLPATTCSARPRLADFIAQSVEAARAVEEPFYHLEFDRVFPDDVYAQILALMPQSRDYRPMHGRSKGHDLDDGTHTRVKIDLFPEYIRNLPAEKRAFWDVVGRALCSDAVKQAFIRRLAPGLAKRFGKDFAKVGMYPIPILTRDIPGYLITPHTDTHWKGITVQLYLPKDDANTDIGTIFHDVKPDGSKPKATQMRFAPNTGYAFAVGDDTWHSADPVHNRVKTRELDPAHLFRRPRAAENPAQPRQAAGQFRAQRVQAKGVAAACADPAIVMAGLVPAISLRNARYCLPKRDARVKPAHDS